MKLSIIIVNWNTKDLLRNALESLYKETNNFDYEVIIIDNNSFDGSVEMVKEVFPDVLLIQNKENLGFSKANNQGLKKAKGDYLMLLNSDVIVLDQAINKLVDYLDKHPDICMVGPKLLNKDMTFQHACRRGLPDPLNSLFYLTGLHKIFKNAKTDSYKKFNMNENESGQTEALSGAAMMFKRKVYEKIGGLDEDFFMYGEDLDFCKRVLDIGWRTFYVSDAEIIHLYGSSSAKRKMKSLINFYNAMWIYYKKHFYSKNNIVFNIVIWTGIKIRLFIALLMNSLK